MLETAPSSRVPAEFIGRARAFWDRVDVVSKETDRIQKASVRRCAHLFAARPGKGFRPDHLVELERHWRTFPPFGTILPLVVTKTPKSFVLRTTRMVTTQSTMISWSGQAERGLVAVNLGVDITPKMVVHNGGPLIVVSAHALSRRFQRGFGVADDDALHLDMLALLAFFKTSGVNADQIGTRFSVLVPGVGRWRGVVRGFTSDDRNFVILDVRTFM